VIVGIDLGTTNSAIAVWNDGSAELVPNALGDLLTPSAIGLGDDGALLVGASARDRQVTHPQLTATSFKRLMGTGRSVQLGGKDFKPEELSALVLRSLREDAERLFETEVTGAIITVPAYFSDKQRKATRRAGELAGLPVRRLINEPTAAALAHGIQNLGNEEPFLIFDLGGGTFDVSIVEIFDGIIEVRASAGDNRLGGNDFDDLFINRITKKLSDKVKEVGSSAFREVVRAAAERCRRQLTLADNAPLRFLWRDVEHEEIVTSSEFELLAEPLLARLRDPVLRSLRDGKTAADQLREVVLVGGATRMPIIRRTVTRMFGRFPNSSIDPDHTVALGAAVQAGLLAKDRALQEVRLTDVCPYSLGVSTAERDFNGRLRTGLFTPVIERNTVIPVSRMESFHTVADSQRIVEFEIFQGEARHVKDNIRLGVVKVPVPPRPAGEVSVDVRFSYDASGLLEIDVVVPETGLSRQLVIQDEEDVSSAPDLERRRQTLAALKVHPRDDACNAATLARAKRCFENYLGDRRVRIGRAIDMFEAELEKQNLRSIEKERKELESLLDQLEGERFL